MRLFCSSFILFNLIVLGTPLTNVAQSATLAQLKERLKKIEQKDNHLKDTAYINAINNVAFIYADQYPDSALAILKGIPEKAEAIGYGLGQINAINNAGNAYQTKGDFDKALEYYNIAFAVAKKINLDNKLPGTIANIGLVYLNQGNYPAALEKFYAALHAAELVNDKVIIRNSFNNIGTIHFYQGKMDDAEAAYQQTLNIAKELSDTATIIVAYNNIGEVNLEQNNPAKALQNLSVAYKLAKLKNVPDMLVAVTNTLGDCYYRLDSMTKAAVYFGNSLELSKRLGNARATCKALIGLSKVQNSEGQTAPALANGLEALRLAQSMGQAQLLRDAYEVVAAVYEKKGDGNNAIKYYKNYKIYADSLVSLESERAAISYKAEYQFSKKEAAFERQALQQRWLIFTIAAALIMLLIILWLINRNRNKLNHSNKRLHHQNVLIEQEKTKVEETLDKLKATQAQLIQAEKMASLGELTSGIAHEIQNPLNFVNNFSEINAELIEELKAEKLKTTGERDEALETELLNDITENEKKIYHHGKRADAIVKGMLQHSQKRSGQKELTDINALCNEYLHLSLMGIRTKDKFFNATIKTNFDETIGKINITPQDIGRVILNVLNNAFYACTERSRNAAPPTPDGGTKTDSNEVDKVYEPTVTVTTHKLSLPSGGWVAQIVISDNGPGIPEKIIDKIFQPFFTTKPSGQGTGLGLSLSYDIIKAHGGNLKVETEEGKGSSFIIWLPAV